MNSKLIALASAATIALTAVAIPNKVEAHSNGWWIPGAVIGGLALGAAVASRPYYYGGDPYYYGGDPYYYGGGPYYMVVVPTTVDAAGGATAIECAAGNKNYALTCGERDRASEERNAQH